MAYSLIRTQNSDKTSAPTPTDPLKLPVTVEDKVLDNSTSLSFPGKNYSAYGEVVGENFLHLLENFASPISPRNPIEGQLWYDNSVSLLKVYTSNDTWTAAGSVTKSSASTGPENPTVGDVWVNPSTLQMFVRGASAWELIGPQYQSGVKTGAIVESFDDALDGVAPHSVTSVYANGVRVLIISSVTFKPKAVLDGFDTIKAGININNTGATVWATAATANALTVGTTEYSSDKFVRIDGNTTFSSELNIQNGNGISIGKNSIFNINVDDTTGPALYSKASEKGISIQTTNSDTKNTVMYVSAFKRVGINTTQPTQTLDVNGGIQATSLTIASTQASTGTGTTDVASIYTYGGITVLKSSNFAGTITTSDIINVGLSDTVFNTTGASVILPIENRKYDIGSSTLQFRNIYAQSFVGTFQGSFNGSFTGEITASKLSTKTAFKLTGDVTSNIINFDGQSGPATFTTTVDSNIIHSKTESNTISSVDELLIYKYGTDAGLRKVKQSTLIGNIATVPIGSIFPFAGTVAPVGYLLCDGSEIDKTVYNLLFGVIGTTYTTTTKGYNTFMLPDLRGRFALGRDNMDNGGFVPDKTVHTLMVDAGGGSANRVTSTTADELGGYGGSESITLTADNLPQHSHTMKQGDNQYYAISQSDTGEGASWPNYSTVGDGTNEFRGFPSSGGVDSDEHGVAISKINPYLTINYIIFTGKLS